MLSKQIAVHKPSHEPFTAEERDLVINNAADGTLVERPDDSVVVIAFPQPIAPAQHKRVVANINKRIKVTELHNHPDAKEYPQSA